jgi:hypothetical protein
MAPSTHLGCFDAAVGLYDAVGHRLTAQPRNRAPAIEADELTRRFGDFVAVDHVSFHIDRGEISAASSSAGENFGVHLHQLRSR